MNEILTYRGFKIVPFSTYHHTMIVRRETESEYTISENIADAYQFIDEQTDGIFFN